MSISNILTALVCILDLASGQKIGSRAEVNPTLRIKQCSSQGCVDLDTSITLDANLRELRTTDKRDCYADEHHAFDPQYCPDADTCACNCALEGADYAKEGVTINPNSNALTLHLFKKVDNVVKKALPRVYLLDEEFEGEYKMLDLLGKEFSFEVDVSNLPCGTNGALYLSEMRANGSANAQNLAGAKYGTGYCDAQCPKEPFVDGKANVNGAFGACCNEFDIWEANKFSSIMSSHPCNITSLYQCNGPLCGQDTNYYKGVCVREGCDFNIYRNGAREFYGPDLTLNTSRRFTVITRFRTDDGTPDGELTEITRLFKQDGRTIAAPRTPIPEGVNPAINDEYCNALKGVFRKTNNYASLGGTAAMGDAIRRGMVLAFSIWFDEDNYMQWLDSHFPANSDPSQWGNLRGPCPNDAGRPDQLQANYADARVTFSNIKIGDIGSTVDTTDLQVPTY